MAVNKLNPRNAAEDDIIELMNIMMSNRTIVTPLPWVLFILFKGYIFLVIKMWCWWCCHPFDNEPLQLPYNYDNRRNKFSTTGNFCSWSCMKSYALEKYGLTKGSIICGNITLMRKRIYNKLNTIKRAPHRYKLDVFGGDLTIEEFRSETLKDESESKPIDSEPIKNNVIPFISSTKKMNEIKNVNDGLVLKRSKPLQRNQNSLETALGLVINPPRNQE